MLTRRQILVITLTALSLVSCQSVTKNSTAPVNTPNTSEPRLIGRWRLIEPATDEEITQVFTEDGKLTYTIDTPEKTQIINLVYQVSGDQITTDQPSHPKKHTSRFYFEPSGILVIDNEGEKTRFQRDPNQESPGGSLKR